MLAQGLIPLLDKRGCRLFAFPQAGLDITDIPAVRKTLESAGPGVVVNCAAYTNVDRAEEEKKEAFSVNAKGPENLARVCGEIGARLVHISTDFVFDGKKTTPYNEEDEPNPLSVYGKSKLRGEENIQKETDDFIIIRTSWLYGRDGIHFVDRILSLARKKRSLGIVFDQVGTPTYTLDLARAIINLLESPSGIYHFSNEGVASWYDLAESAVEMARDKGVKMKLKEIRPILTEEYPAPAKRPDYSVLDKSKYKKVTGALIPHWRESLSRYIEGEMEA